MTQGKLNDIQGRRFGRWTVLALIPKDEWRKSKAEWECRCDCGVTKRVIGQNLVRGLTESCGCLRSELLSERKAGNLHNLRHGHAFSGYTTSEYRAWAKMKDRCLNPDSRSFADYGGRGITVCDRWIDGFENFLDDMGPKPGPRLSIDRIDNDGNYEPGNCRWATQSQQNANRRPRKK